MPGTTTREVRGQRLSGKDTRPAGAPRATIVALHGGGYSAGYWDHPLDPAASLHTLGSALGYRVVAIDRPGYGASHGLVRDSVRADRQTEIVLDLIDMLQADGDTGAAVFIIGHSTRRWPTNSSRPAWISCLTTAGNSGEPCSTGPTGPSTRT
jgi:pimeloyl-ACP methyl ester carboxylesterase